MSEPKVYVIDRIADLIHIPTERRAACLRQIEYALELHEFAFGDEAAQIDIGTIQWTDDEKRSVTLSGADGPMLTLEITGD